MFCKHCGCRLYEDMNGLYNPQNGSRDCQHNKYGDHEVDEEA